MAKFVDAEGREWIVALDVATLKRVKTLTGTDLLKLIDPKGGTGAALAEDLIALCDALFAVVKPEADARKVTDEDFGRALRGDALEAATNALMEALIDFFPKPRREMMRRAFGKMTQLQQDATGIAGQKLEAMLAEAEREIQALKQKPLSGDAPASSA